MLYTEFTLACFIWHQKRLVLFAYILIVRTRAYFEVTLITESINVAYNNQSVFLGRLTT